jgi:hypothetical protein
MLLFLPHFRSSPFDRDWHLQVPRGFQIRVVSRIPAAVFWRDGDDSGSSIASVDAVAWRKVFQLLHKRLLYFLAPKRIQGLPASDA